MKLMIMITMMLIRMMTIEAMLMTMEELPYYVCEVKLLFVGVLVMLGITLVAAYCVASGSIECRYIGARSPHHKTEVWKGAVAWIPAK